MIIDKGAEAHNNHTIDDNHCHMPLTTMRINDEGFARFCRKMACKKVAFSDRKVALRVRKSGFCVLLQCHLGAKLRITPFISVIAGEKNGFRDLNEILVCYSNSRRSHSAFSA